MFLSIFDNNIRDQRKGNTDMKNLQYENIFRKNVLEAFVNRSSYAFYIVEGNSILTILYANQAFYQLLNVDEAQVRYQYGNSLTALIDTQKYRFDQEADSYQAFLHEAVIQKEKKLLYTQIQAQKEEHLYYCISLDVSDYQKVTTELAELKKIIRGILPQINAEIMMYHVASNDVHFLTRKHLYDNLGEHTTFAQLYQYLEKRMKVSDHDEHMLKKEFEKVMKFDHSLVKEVNLLDGKWLRFTMQPQYDMEHHRNILIMIEDVTAEKSVYLDYLNETKFYHMLLSEKDAYGHVNVTKDQFYATGGIWDLYNELSDELSFSELFLRFVTKVVYPQDREDYIELMDRNNLMRSYENGNHRLKFEFRRILEQNKMMWMEIEIFLFQEPIHQDLLALMVLTDIDQRKKTNFQLKYRPQIDPLFDIYHTNSIHIKIDQTMMHVQATQLQAFLIIRHENIKHENDASPQHTKETRYMEFSENLQKVFHERAIWERVGDDTFVVYMEECEDKSEIIRCLKQLEDGMENHTMKGCHIGIAVWEGSWDYETAFAMANQALHQAKEDQNGGYAFYDILQNHCTLNMAQGENHASNIEQGSSLRTVLSMNQFHEYLGKFGEMAYVVNPQTYDLLLGNQSFYDRVGLTLEQCRNQKCYEVLHHRKSPCPFCGRANWSKDKFFVWRDHNETLEQDFLMKNRLISWEKEEVLLALAIDISNDKSITDSMESEVVKSHYLLNSVQHMQEHMQLDEAMKSILESICHYFHATSAGIWQRNADSDQYELTFSWSKHKEDGNLNLNEQEKKAYHTWLLKQRWDQPIFIEHPQDFLGNSYDMYHYMQEHHIQNQRWICLQDQAQEYGCLLINNIQARFRNTSYLDALAIFIINEIKKYHLLDAVIHANRYDYLTDLMNRNSFEHNCPNYNGDNITSLGVISGNIDHLKEINRVNGTAIGDQYIIHLANLLKLAFPNADIYRLNGDEFLVICVDLAQAQFEKQVSLLKQKAQNENFRTSFGYAWDNVEKKLDPLLLSATKMMQLNKKAHYEEFHESVDMLQRKLLRDLMDGIAQKEFEIFLQPKMLLDGQTVVGAEALIRQRHREFGIQQPSQFVPALESNSLIRYIDLYVFEEVCKLLEEWKDRDLSISLNFSRVTLMEETIIENMKQILTRYDFPRNHMEIEITESAIEDNSKYLYETARAISSLGLHLSLDDFGICYSNLSVLSEIFFDTIKLDKSLIVSVVSNRRNRLILKNIIQMCKDLNMASIAEGIETKVQEDMLRELGCTIGQGYLYGKPIPIQAFKHAFIKEAERL